MNSGNGSTEVCIYSDGQINVVKGCMSRGLNLATFKHVFLASRLFFGIGNCMTPQLWSCLGAVSHFMQFLADKSTQPSIMNAVWEMSW